MLHFQQNSHIAISNHKTKIPKGYHFRINIHPSYPSQSLSELRHSKTVNSDSKLDDPDHNKSENKTNSELMKTNSL